MPKLAKRGSCTGCMACMNICSHKAISFDIKNGEFQYQIEPNKCVECGLCEKICPVLNIKYLKSTEKVESKPFAVYSNCTETLINSASGGFFTELSQYLFDKCEKENIEIAVVGAAINKTKVYHKIITKKEDIIQLQGTKYLHSDIGYVYKQVYSFLKRDTIILFSGLPCQVYGLYSYLKNRHYIGKLLTCDLICNGVPDFRLLDIEVKSKNIDNIYSFRDKVDGWHNCLAIKYKNKNNVVRDDLKSSFFLKAFQKNYALRNSCYNCKFTGIKRLSDYTIGDYWGGDNLDDKEKKEGVSLVICHSVSSFNILKKMRDSKRITVKDIEWNECLPGNPRIYIGRRFIQYIIPKYFRNILMNTYYRIFEGDFNNNNIIYKYFKLRKLIFSKIENRYRKYRLNNILKLYDK